MCLMELEVTNDYLIEVIMILWDSFSILIKKVCGLWSSPNILGLANEEKTVWKLSVALVLVQLWCEIPRFLPSARAKELWT